MRSLEQRIAEINRRSEEIMKKRKLRRKQLMITCIPVVLCVSLACAFGLPGLETHDGVAPGTPEHVVVGCPQKGSADYVRMEIAGQDFTTVSEDPNRFIAFVESLQTDTLVQSDNNSAVCDEGMSAGTRGDGTEDKNSQTYYSATNEYTVSLVKANGKSVRYRLAGNTLWEENTDVAYALTAKQAEELRKLLGISDP